MSDQRQPLKLCKKIVLTGACGNLGMQIRETLAELADELLSVDIADAPENLAPNETFVQADCSNFDAVFPLMKGATMAVHFASIADERPFEQLLGPNYLSSYNIWEAAYQNGVQRIIYASSIHAVGMVETAAGPNLTQDHAPDTFYGLAKCFAEDLGKLYWAKRGVESVHMRIASCTPEPQNPRALRTWLSYDDLRHLVDRAVQATTTGFTVIYGVSNNDRSPVDNAKAAHLGYRPKDNAEDWAPTLLANAQKADPLDKAQLCLGGPFATVPLGESGVAGIKAMQSSENKAGAAPKQSGKLPAFLTNKNNQP